MASDTNASGNTQFELMRVLLRRAHGATVEHLAQELRISKSAVRQHLVALERDQLVTKGNKKPSGGRPEQLYILTNNGKETFPRQYSWFSELLLTFLAEELGDEDLQAALCRIGTEVGANISQQAIPSADLNDRIKAMAEVMRDKGYDAQPDLRRDKPEIVASNCVFHALALKNPTVCKFDIALLEAGCGCKVEHVTCMAKGAESCRFRMTP